MSRRRHPEDGAQALRALFIVLLIVVIGCAVARRALG